MITNRVVMTILSIVMTLLSMVILRKRIRISHQANSTISHNRGNGTARRWCPLEVLDQLFRGVVLVLAALTEFYKQFSVSFPLHVR